jgi:hypothetical protein
MQEVRVPINKFDAKGFTNDIIRFLKVEVLSDGADPISEICVVTDKGLTPDWGEKVPGRDIIRELVEEGKTLFFPFSNVGCSDPIVCANGKEYDLDDEEYDLGESDLVGYLLKVTNGIVSIRQAIHLGGGCPVPPPSVEVIETAGPFEQGMSIYIKKYINK